jgi:hypothetical protein
VLPLLHRWDLPADRARHRGIRSCRPLSLTREDDGILEMLLAARTSHRTRPGRAGLRRLHRL